MFRRATVASVTLILAMSGLVYFLHVPWNDVDLAKYQKLLDESAKIHASQSRSHPIELNREEVKKEIWTDGGMHFNMKSDHSHLVIGQKSSQLHLREESQGCEGTVFKEVPAFWSAKRGTYVNGELFLEGDVKLEEASRKIMAQTAHVTKDAIHLEGSVCLKNENGSLFSQAADCQLTSLSPTIFNASGHVRFITTAIKGKESFGVADHLLYRFNEEILFLTSLFPKRVLFVQEGSTLSAPEIQIQKGIIQGIGDVHFVFDLDEKNTIAELFSKHL